MNTTELSTREKIMFRIFRQNARSKTKTSVEELMTALRRMKTKPRGGTRSLTVSVRYLGYKLAPKGYVIERVSALGRGNKAEYEMRKLRGKRN